MLSTKTALEHDVQSRVAVEVSVRGVQPPVAGFRRLQKSRRDAKSAPWCHSTPHLPPGKRWVNYIVTWTNRETAQLIWVKVTGYSRPLWCTQWAARSRLKAAPPSSGPVNPLEPLDRRPLDHRPSNRLRDRACRSRSDHPRLFPKSWNGQHGAVPSKREKPRLRGGRGRASSVRVGPTKIRP
jgi:hypothetical protein